MPPVAFTPADVVALYLHRGAFETVLSDEDKQQDPDRWVSQTACGQEFWQVISQWMANLRLELGHRLHPTSLRMTEVAEASPKAQRVGSQLDGQDDPESRNPNHNSSAVEPSDPFAPTQETSSLEPAPRLYGPPQFAQTKRAGKFAGTDFPEQPDGTLRCPANHPLAARNSKRRGQWDRACPLCRTTARLSSVSIAAPVSLAWRTDQGATPGERCSAACPRAISTAKQGDAASCPNATDPVGGIGANARLDATSFICCARKP